MAEQGKQNTWDLFVPTVLGDNSGTVLDQIIEETKNLRLEEVLFLRILEIAEGRTTIHNPYGDSIVSTQGKLVFYNHSKDAVAVVRIELVNPICIPELTGISQTVQPQRSQIDHNFDYIVKIEEGEKETNPNPY